LNRSGRLPGAFLAVMLTVQGVHAQASAESEGVRTMPFFGFAVGAGSIPRAFEPNCVDGWDGHAASGAIELRLGVQRGRFSLESRTTPQTEVGLSGAADCLFESPVRPDGTHVLRASPIDRGPFVMTDVRANVAVRQEPFTWLISTGAGWVWSRKVPTLILGTGVRWGNDLRGVVDAEWVGFRLPFERVTEQWFNATVVSRTADNRQDIWQSGFSIRVGVEVLLNR